MSATRTRRPAADPAVQEVRDGMNRLRGELFGLIDLAGMPARQEESFKRLVRRVTYENQTNLEAALRGGGRD